MVETTNRSVRFHKGQRSFSTSDTDQSPRARGGQAEPSNRSLRCECCKHVHRRDFISREAMIDPFGRAKLLLSPLSGRLARRLALPVGMSHQRPRKVYDPANSARRPLPTPKTEPGSDSSCVRKQGVACGDLHLDRIVRTRPWQVVEAATSGTDLAGDLEVIVRLWMNLSFHS